ncbi:MAG: hypothetical protein ABJH06_05770 [Paraglaciecola sp.]|uniref:hypothetical protein n=1 Tax=Paraglaciecola sp. TaxID=1920173 RepID=UPI003299FE1A
MKVYKQYRRKIKLINLNQAMLNQTTFAKQMNEQGVSIYDRFDYQLITDFNLLLACQHVRQEQRLVHLNLVLTASSLPVCESIDLVLNSNKMLNLNAADISAKKDLEKNIETLNNQLKEKENAIGLAKQALKGEQKNIDALQKELELQSFSMEQQTKSDQQEHELLELQLASVQEELEQFYLDFETEKHKYKQAELQLTTQLKGTLAKLKAEKSEGELLELQLGQVQEELEEYFLFSQSKDKEITVFKTQLKSLNKKKTDLEKQLDSSNNLVVSLNNKVADLNATIKQKDKDQAKNLRQIKLKQMELNKQASQIVKTKSENSILNHNLNQAKAEITQIKSSTFWKSADPVRKLVKAVGNMDKKKAILQENIGLLLTSEYFDAAWYLETYPDVAASEINPAEHYLKFGAKEGRFPSPQFDGKWYLQRYPDIADADVNPLIHFIKFGISEGRSASPKMLVNHNKP